MVKSKRKKRGGSKGRWTCPACKGPIAPVKISQHSQTCEGWKKKFGDPLPKFKYCPYDENKQPLYQKNAQEEVDYVQCKVCAWYGYDLRFSRVIQHLKAHGLSEQEYKERYPGAKVRLKKTQDRRKKTTLEKYGVDNAAKDPEVKRKIKETNEERHGGLGSASPKIRAKIEQTNLKNLGVKNPFERQDLVQEGMVKKYGVHNPALVPEIIEKRKATCWERYGGASYLTSPEWIAKIKEEALQRKQIRRHKLIESDNFEICHYCNEVFTKVTSTHKAICEGWPETPVPLPCLCGHESTSLTQMKRHRDICGVWQNRDVEKIKRERWLQTFQNNYGERYTSPTQVSEIIERIKQTCLREYGVEWASMSKEVQDKMKETCLERYGTEHAINSPEVQQKIKESCFNSLGVENPFGSWEIKEQIIRTCLELYCDFDKYDSPALSEQDLLDRYGLTHPMQHKEYAIKRLYTQSSENLEPNKFEQKVLDLSDQLIYTGNRTFWRWLPKLGHHKNPDFIVSGPDMDFPRRDVTKVIECNGNYWHSEQFTGKPPHEHEREIIETYEDVGIRCLVIWEEEVNHDLEAVRERVREFLI